jgi:hypothetical protein
LNYALAAMTSKFIFVTFNTTLTMNYVIHSNLRLLTILHYIANHFLKFFILQSIINISFP